MGDATVESGYQRMSLASLYWMVARVVGPKKKLEVAKAGQ